MSGSRLSRSLMPLTGALLAGLALSGCSTLRPTQKAFAPDEYNVRHPIKIAETVRHIDIFGVGHKLDRRQHADIIAFGKEFTERGRGAIRAAVPSGGGVSIAAIRAALAESGARIPLEVTQYQADRSQGAAPVRLSFLSLQANLASQCGLWPSDIAGSKELETWHNRPYHNFGCAYQSMIAAQVADPIDLVRSRAEGQADTIKRTKDIEALRKDQDPSTKWAKDDAKVKEAQQ